MKKKDNHWYGWCIVCEGVGPIWPTFAETRRHAIAKLGTPLKQLPLYKAVKVYIALAKA